MDPQTAAHPLDPLLHKLQLWLPLDAHERAAVLALPTRVQKVERGKYIIRDGEVATHCCLLISGFAFREKVVSDGGRSISAIHMRGDLVDLQNSLLGVADHSVRTLTPCTVAFIPREEVKQIALSLPNIGMAMWYDTLVDASIFREWIANIARRNAPSRIAHLLCEFGTRLEAAGLGAKLKYELPMTQEQLADCTGLTAVHVNRTLRSLEASGDIVRSFRDVAIADWDKLRTTAGFQADYLHLPRGVTIQAHDHS